MSSARWGAFIAVLATVASAGAVVACGADSTSAFGPESGADLGDAGLPPIAVPSSDAAQDSAPQNDGGATVRASSTALFLLHASYDLPAVRVCFESAGSLAALPRSNLMPSSNLPGLDVGRVVRIGDLGGVTGLAQKPKVHVFVESAIRGTPDAACSALLADVALKKGEHRYEAKFVDATINTGAPLVLVLEGCITAATPDAKCAPAGTKDRDLAVRAISLPTPTAAGASNLHWQPVNVAPELPSAAIWFAQTFADTAPTASAAFGQVGAVQTTPFDRSVIGNYASFAFGVRAGGINLTQASMADVQDVSLPGAVPSEFYVPEASMALFIVGSKEAVDAAPDARALHVVAVPIAPDTPAADQ
jgi:hypothetical protein